MLYREDLEKREYEILSPAACKVADSKGRKMPEEKDLMRTDFQRDRDRIIHSKAFRRLMHKTQVFLSTEGDHFRTRLSHTLEVSQIARSVSRGLALNEDLAEAISLGHDLGHTPFGHSGETILNGIHKGGFRHNEQSLRVVDVIESSMSRKGMNLTEEVRDGILNHTGDTLPMTLEGQVVKISDRIAYINHDIDDALRSEVIKFDELPRDCIRTLGESHKNRITNMINNLIQTSEGEDVIKMTKDFQDATNKLRTFMFEKVYKNSKVKKDEDLNRVKVIIESLYKYYVENPDKLPYEFTETLETDGVEEAVKDYVAGMTDRFAIRKYVDLFVPAGWK